MMGASDIPPEIFTLFSGSKKSADAGPTADKEEEDRAKSIAKGKNAAGRPGTASSGSSDFVLVDDNDNDAEEPKLEPTRQTTTAQSQSQSTSNVSSPTVNLETALDASKGVGKVVTAGIKSPMDFTMALASGFRNAPKLYGDDTLRPTSRVTGFQSGLKAAGKVSSNLIACTKADNIR